MADAGAQETSQGPTSPARRGGRGRGRGRGGPTGGRGRGSRGRGDGANSRGGRAAADKGKVPAEEGGERAGTLPTVSRPPVEEADDDDAEVCFICASPVQHTAIAPCNHRTCHICSIRMRALYKTKACAHCRTESDHVILTDAHEQPYQEFSATDFFKVDDNLGIKFEKAEIFEDARLLLQYNCPDSECDVACLGWPDLHRHTKTAHGTVMCDLCTRNKKVFTHEHELFTFAELRKHQKFGDDNPGAIDQSGFKGHPECGFCRQRFYGDDELYTHCRDKHERCHICDRREGHRQQQYYVNYDALEQHFRKDHFVCPDRECLEKKFVVFDSEMDLKAHQIESHPNGLTKDALRDARRVDMSGFGNFRTPHEPEHNRRDDRRREGGRPRGRGRDPNAEAVPASSAQPLSRAELAYQRQMEAQQSGATGRAFGGQLSAPTPGEAFAARPAPSASAPSTQTVSRPSQPIANNVSNGISQLSLNSQPTPQTPQEQARLLRHNAVTERASNMLRGDQVKLQQFRADVSAYRTDKVSPAQFIEGLFALFDSDSKELGKLVKELADIFEIPAKQQGLLKAWSDWKAINEDYPSLPGSATERALNGGTATSGGSRVLKLKSSTAQSQRSQANRKASWSTASSGPAFPALPAAASSSRSGGIGAKPGQTPWMSSTSKPAATRSTGVSPIPSRVASSSGLAKKSNAAIADAFPALPAAPKPTSTIFSPGYTGLGLRRDNSGRNTPVNAAWGAPSAGASGSTTPVVEENAGGKKKGNKNKKQTLFHFG
ncbi:hypothetical protein OPT61_g9635 [Boeremia exigua]|uniref:Uncharacterized protein n=1 Tax=Boeremia exigua TaxID=749465 RepID=A0ACC2HTR2_9PLEO|nr:hypothetical protein OPT61_g9635 [Boeremia exigua]